MALKRCAKGHYYDASKHTSCPVCGVAGLGLDNDSGQAVAPPPPKPEAPKPKPEAPEPRPAGMDPERTAPMDPAVAEPSPLRRAARSTPARTQPRSGPAGPPEYNPTRRRGEPPAPSRLSDDDARTRRVMADELSIDPVVGWLVCVEGVEKGSDYKIFSEKNFIGRSSRMHICIRGDRTVSRDKHAILSFNPRNNAYKIQPGESSGIVYLNGVEVDVPMDLKEYDVIELGQTKLLFVPLCGKGFQWA